MHTSRYTLPEMADPSVSTGLGNGRVYRRRIGPPMGRQASLHSVVALTRFGRRGVGSTGGYRLELEGPDG